MFCPYHGDSKRSASINVETGLWNCMGCNASGQAQALIADKENWIIVDRVAYTRRSGARSRRVIEVNEAEVEGWHSALLSNRPVLAEFRERRGFTLKTLRRYQIGWDSTYKAYTIPVRDGVGELQNVRFYKLDPPEGRRKIWGVAGHNEPHLYPFDQLENNTVVICEGEWDALLSIQNGVPAVTRTSTADAWDPRWNVMFLGKRVIICHDMDTKGQVANEKLAAMLNKSAASITVVTLPYPVETKHGKDLTDYWLAGHTKYDLADLVKEGTKHKSRHERMTDPEETKDAKVIGVMDSFDAALVGEHLMLPVTVAGKRIPSFLIPVEFDLTCDTQAGKKCESCSVLETGGKFHGQLHQYDPAILGMINVPEDRMMEVLLKRLNVEHKCPRFEVEMAKHITVEEIYVRPSVELDRHSEREQDFTHRKVISSASHDLLSNQTVDLHGSIYPNPATQANEFLAWNVVKPESMFESFKMDDAMLESLAVFQTNDPIAKLKDIADDISTHVTKIFYRRDMHIFMDLVFHSCLEFALGEEHNQKGWLDGIIIGDTRTGKSEAALRFINEYGVGEMISCESATYAGVVGGLDRTGDGKWIVKWGSIPVNDRRLCALDEFGGLSTDQIAQMSSIRSSGIAEMTKIQTERANARTRLLIMANPRNTRMDDFTFGVQALRPLIGNNEDIARFDIAMGVFSREVPAEKINLIKRKRKERRYPTEALRALVRWAWTRRSDDIVFSPGVREHILEVSNRMGNEYSEDPPLVQGANIRLKIARVAIAIAMRTFSSDATGAQCLVQKMHVDAAEAFFTRVYGNPNFGYRTLSDQRTIDLEVVEHTMDDTMNVLVSHPNLLRFLRTNPSFTRQMLDNVMNMSRDSLGALISELWSRKIIFMDGDDMKLESAIVEKIRETTS